MKTRAAALALCAGVVAMGMGHAREAGPVLEVTDVQGRVVEALPVREGERCDLSFVHSAERTPWIQHYRIRRAGIEQVGSSFSSYGAGMPALAVEGEFARDANRVRYDMRASWGALRLMNSRTASLTLRCRNRTVALGEMFDEYALFTLRVR